MQDEVQLETTKCVHAFPPAHMCEVPLCWSAVLPSLYLVSPSCLAWEAVLWSLKEGLAVLGKHAHPVLHHC